MVDVKIRQAGEGEPPPERPTAAVETPSARIIAQAADTVRVTDGRGRSIGIRKIGVLDRARLFEMIGAENSKNESFLSIAVPAYMVVEINGVAMRRPLTRRELDARITELDDDGLEAVNLGIMKHFAPPDAEGDPGTVAADAKETLKNGAGTPA